MAPDPTLPETVLVERPGSQRKAGLYPEAVCDNRVKTSNMIEGRHLLGLQREHGFELKNALARRFGAPPPDLDDAIQSALLKFMELDGAAKVKNVRAFLFAMARNIVLDELRRMNVREKFRRHEIRSASLPTIEESTPEKILMNRERYDLLNDAINTLPEQAKQLIVYSRIENMTYAEISGKTGLSPAYISRSIQKSLDQLLKHLKEKGLESA